MHGPKHLEKVLERRAEVEAEVGLRLPMAKRRTCFLYLRVEALESPWGGSRVGVFPSCSLLLPHHFFSRLLSTLTTLADPSPSPSPSPSPPLGPGWA